MQFGTWNCGIWVRLIVHPQTVFQYLHLFPSFCSWDLSGSDHSCICTLLQTHSQIRRIGSRLYSMTSKKDHQAFHIGRDLFLKHFVRHSHSEPTSILTCEAYPEVRKSSATFNRKFWLLMLPRKQRWKTMTNWNELFFWRDTLLTLESWTYNNILYLDRWLLGIYHVYRVWLRLFVHSQTFFWMWGTWEMHQNLCLGATIRAPSNIFSMWNTWGMHQRLRLGATICAP